MTSRLLEEGKQARLAGQERAKAASKELEEDVAGLTSSLDREIRARVATISANAATIEKQTADLQGSARRMGKINKQCGSILNSTQIRLKDIGHLQNWVELLDQDMTLLDGMLAIVDGEQ